ncbi:MAG: protein kinase, partial [Chloroflexi bacterium]|nr:protein kinase [Chloroflexota bacterium]
MELGKFEILEELGRGGFGVVYKARDKSLNRLVAIKVLHPNLVNDPTFLARFQQEAKIAANLDHTNTVPVYGFGAADGRYYIVMAYMPGGSLKDLLKRKGPLSPQQALEVFSQIGEGLSYAHRQNVIHRDLKPGNILFDSLGRARISDMGFAKLLQGGDSVSMSASGGLVGTPAYMAPEIWRGKGASASTDVYSLACNLVEMLTAKPLFAGETTPEVMFKHFEPLTLPEDIPVKWREVIGKGLEKDPKNRYRSVQEFVTQLQLAEIKPAQTTLYSQQTAYQADKPQAQPVIEPEPQPVRGASEKQEQPERTPARQQQDPAGKPVQRTPVIVDKQGHPVDPVKPGRSGTPAYKKIPAFLQNKLPVYIILGLLALAGVIVGIVIVNNSRKAAQQFADSRNQPTQTGVFFTPQATPTPTAQVIVEAGSVQALSMGGYENGVYGEVSYGGVDNPTWADLDSGSTDELILLGTEKNANLRINTNRNVGAMFSLSSRNFGSQNLGNNQLYVYGDSSLTLKNDQGITDITLMQGAVYINLVGPSEITHIKMPSHGDVSAELIGGELLLELKPDTVTMWCLREQCSLNYGNEYKRLSAPEVRVYKIGEGVLLDGEQIVPPGERYDEYYLWNLKCNHCLPFEKIYTPTRTATAIPPTRTPTTPPPTWTPTTIPSNTPTATTLVTTIPTETQTTPPT